MQIAGFAHRDLTAVCSDLFQPLRFARHIGAFRSKLVRQFGIAFSKNQSRLRRFSHHRNERSIRLCLHGKHFQSLRQNRPHIGNHVSGNRFHEKGDFIRQRCSFFINRRQPFHMRRPAVIIPYRFDAFFRDCRARLYIRINGDRITVSCERFHLKTWINQCIAGRKRIILCSCKHTAWRNRQIHFFYATAQQFSRVTGIVRIVPCCTHGLAFLHPELLVFEPAGQLFLLKFGCKQQFQPRIEKLCLIFHLFSFSRL